jgi:hypothetical protein
MPIDILTGNVWLSLAAWIILYVSDYGLTLTGARLYRSGADQHIIFEGSYELNPVFEHDIDLLRRFSPKFVLFLVSTSAILLIAWRIAAWLGIPEVYAFIFGYLVLLEVAILMRHLRNLILFHFIDYFGGVEGQLRYSRWLSLRLSAFEFIEFAVLFLLLFLATNHWIFAGGAVSCFMTGYVHSRHSYLLWQDSPILISGSQEQSSHSGTT